MGKLYSNALLATLNARHLRHASGEVSDISMSIRSASSMPGRRVLLSDDSDNQAPAEGKRSGGVVITTQTWVWFFFHLSGNELLTYLYTEGCRCDRRVKVYTSISPSLGLYSLVIYSLYDFVVWCIHVLHLGSTLNGQNSLARSS